MVPPSVLPEAHFPGGGDGIAAVREENVFSVVVPPPASVTVGLVAAVSFPGDIIVAKANGRLLFAVLFARSGALLSVAVAGGRVARACLASLALVVVRGVVPRVVGRARELVEEGVAGGLICRLS